MADLKVEIFKISEIKEHPNADRMELAFIGAWQTCIPIGKFKTGDRVIYFPVDCIVPADVENILFPPGSLVKLTRSRIKSIKLRGAMSQGMVEHPETLGLNPNIKVGTDVAKKLGITKYQPPKKNKPGMMKARPKRHRNPCFKQYTNIGHFKYYPECFKGLKIWGTEKVHGTNFRAGCVKYNAYNWWRKIARYFNISGFQWEFVYGSHRVELTRKPKRETGFYKQNVYYLMAEKYNLRELLAPGEVIYAEIYGCGIQKGYDYGCELIPGKEWKMVVVDVMINDKYINGHQAKQFCDQRDLPYAPVLIDNEIFDFDAIEKVVNAKGNKSALYPKLQRPMEGIVIKPMEETLGYMGRMVFKWINDKYWLNKDNSDWH
jgi:RNA ligase (TIGR02306 family)